MWCHALGGKILQRFAENVNEQEETCGIDMTGDINIHSLIWYGGVVHTA